MLLTTLQLQQFRCFRETEWQFRPGINLIEGPNGSGKTSLLEALHYLCYLRSFRTFFTRELIQAGQTGFFVRAQFAATADPAPTAQTSLQIGFSPQKRIIKVAQREVQSYRELLALYTAISFVEDDLTLIKGEPSLRRTFLDQFIALYVPSYLSLLSDYKRTLVNRNALIQRLARHTQQPPAEYAVWTEQLQTKAQSLQTQRAHALQILQQTVNQLLASYFPTAQLQIELQYRPKVLTSSMAELWSTESRWKRSLFGAHLDDFTISFAQLQSRAFASRGQQKLILTLLKLAQKVYLAQLALPATALTSASTPLLTAPAVLATNISIANNSAPSDARVNLAATTSALPAGLFLLDDFMTDLDHHWLQILVQALQDLNCQLLFTAPTQPNSPLRAILQQYPLHLIQL